MEDTEIIEYLKSNKETRANFQISAILDILARAMIKKGWFTEEKFNDLVEKSLDNVLKDVIKRMSAEQREMIETQIKISKDPLFGNLFNSN